jgi:hypothetical protein
LAFAGKSIKKDVTIQILRDLAVTIKRAFKHKGFDLDDVTTHAEMYNHFHVDNGMYTFHCANDIGKALCFIYYIIDNLDEVESWPKEERQYQVDNLFNHIEIIRCWLIVEAYKDDINFCNFIDCNTCRRKKNCAKGKGPRGPRNPTTYISDLFKFLREKYAGSELGRNKTHIAKGETFRIGLDEAIRVHILKGHDTAEKMWRYFKNNYKVQDRSKDKDKTYSIEVNGFTYEVWLEMDKNTGVERIMYEREDNKGSHVKRDYFNTLFGKIKNNSVKPR